MKQISNSLAKAGRVTISQETLERRLLQVFFNTPLLYPVEHWTHIAPFTLRPSSDVVLLRRAERNCNLVRLQHGRKATVDSDVVPESNQIQDLLMPRNNSYPKSPWERNLAKIH